uniref:Large ribosomal subunit protein uL23m n=1 Tax=Panagrellus redivivus TaxID=6233 RepID=A0A7E4VH25_PANRE
MTTRISRLWQPGNPQNRVFFPDFWLKVVETPKVGYKRLPKNAAKFEIDQRMSRTDVREYLEKIYKLPVRDVRIENKLGDITWNAPLDKEKRRAIWKDDDRKFAYVYFAKEIEFNYPVIFTETDEVTEDLEKMKKFLAEDHNNEKFVNRDRAGIGNFFGV